MSGIIEFFILRASFMCLLLLSQVICSYRSLNLIRRTPLPPATVAMVAVGGTVLGPSYNRVKSVVSRVHAKCSVTLLFRFSSNSCVRIFFWRKQPPPATGTMVAGGGGLIYYLLMC